MSLATLFKPGFLDYFRSGQFADVTIITERRTYRAHRMVLAFSSEFFEAMLLSDFQESHTDVIDLTKLDDPHNIFPEVMKILYCGRVELNTEKVVALLAMSDVLMIKVVHEKCMEFISTHLNKSTALMFLVDAIALNQERLARTCLNVLAASFLHICDDTDFSVLDPKHFVQLLCHPRLAVTDEWKLFNVIIRYLHAHNTHAYPCPGNPTMSDTIESLMKNVRFYFFTLEQLIQASQLPLLPRHLLVDPLLSRLAHADALPSKTSLSSPSGPTSTTTTPGETAALSAPKITFALPSHLQFKHRISSGIRFEAGEEEIRRRHGILYWLGRKEGTAPWSNPATAGLVTVHASSVERGHPHYLVETEPQELWTHDVPASWLSIDLGRYRVLPHAYMLRHGGNYRADSLRNWDFQGSVDGKTWIALKRHSNDSTLGGPFAVHTFLLDKVAPVPYQWFRIIQTGHNSTNHNFLVLSGLELYGELWEKDAWEAALSATSSPLLNSAATHSVLTQSPTSPPKRHQAYSTKTSGTGTPTESDQSGMKSTAEAAAAARTGSPSLRSSSWSSSLSNSSSSIVPPASSSQSSATPSATSQSSPRATSQSVSVVQPNLANSQPVPGSSSSPHSPSASKRVHQHQRSSSSNASSSHSTSSAATPFSSSPNEK